jgi:hypothetical protein
MQHSPRNGLFERWFVAGAPVAQGRREAADDAERLVGQRATIAPPDGRPRPSPGLRAARREDPSGHPDTLSSHEVAGRQKPAAPAIAATFGDFRSNGKRLTLARPVGGSLARPAG